MTTTAPYRDPNTSIDDRVADLLARMTLEEKAAQTAAPFGATVDVHDPPATGWGLVVAGLSTLGALPRDAARAANELQRKHVEDTRLGIPVLFGEEGLIGLKVREATVFPDALAQAATWQPELVGEMAARIGARMREIGVRQVLSPLADVARDPRWGRVEETYGEDPYLVGSMASAFVRGVQGTDGQSPIVATLKHFIAYSASDGGRNTGDVHLGRRELRERYGIPFEMVIRGAGVRSVMPSYSAVDGEPVTGSANYLTSLLRTEYGFDGFVTADLAAVEQLHSKHAIVPDRTSAFAKAIRAGVDADLDNAVSSDLLVTAVQSGLLEEAELDRAVAAVLRAKFELGLFENPYVDLDRVPETLDPAEDRALARLISEKSIVLLKNDEVGGSPLLPLRADLASIAVIGPNADRVMGQLGNYAYQVLDSMMERFRAGANPQAVPETFDSPDSFRADNAKLLVETVPIVTPLQGIRARAGARTRVTYEPGSLVDTQDRSGFAAAVRAASNAELAIVVVGDQAGVAVFGTVGEGLDSTDCALPGVQRELVEAVVATGTPTVVVLTHGRPFVLDWMAEAVPAIVTSFFGGEEAGSAIAGVLFGDTNPAGRLPVTLLRSIGAAPAPYPVTLSGKNSYVDGTAAALFPFGHGLSYTTFEYADLEIAAADGMPTDGTFTASFTVTNTGETAGDEVVQLYGIATVARTVRSGRSLVGFTRLTLDPGASARVSMAVPTSMFAIWDAAEGWVVDPGRIDLFVGASAADVRLEGHVTLEGDPHIAGPDRALTSSVTVDGASRH